MRFLCLISGESLLDLRFIIVSGTGFLASFAPAAGLEAAGFVVVAEVAGLAGDEDGAAVVVLVGVDAAGVDVVVVPTVVEPVTG